MPHEPVVLVLAATFVVMKILCTKPLFDHFHSGIHAESRSTLPTDSGFGRASYTATMSYSPSSAGAISLPRN
jgi:hypothetical protein